jgi:hypothetical protein
MNNYYAAIGTDGSNTVVWSVGLTKDAALASGKENLASEGRESNLKVTPINETQWKLIYHSSVYYPAWAALQALANAHDALESKWGFTKINGGGLLCEGSDNDSDDAEAELMKIQEIVRKYHCEANWTGNGNTDGDGYTTSDVRIEYIGNR